MDSLLNSEVKKYIPKEAVLSSKLKMESKNAGIAYMITKARNENLRIIQKKEVEPLKEIALKKVSESFSLNKNLALLDRKSRDIIYDMMDISEDIFAVFEIINYEKYWERACKLKYKVPDVLMHGCSWKQCYAENYIRDLITNFTNENGQTEEELKRIFNMMKNYVFNLEICQFSADFNISFISDYFLNITTLSIKFSPRLNDKPKENVFQRKLERKLIHNKKSH